MSIHNLRERANLWLAGHKDTVLKTFKWLNVFVSALAILTLIYFYGFSHSAEVESIILGIIEGSFAFYVVHYIVRLIYDFNPQKFLRRTWTEGFLMFWLVIEGISQTFFDTLLLAEFFEYLGFITFRDVGAVLVQIYIVTVVLVEFAQSRAILPRFNMNPAWIFIASFMVIIWVGTGLLMLPEMTTRPGSMNFIDALFTSTSATCVTGLMVEDAGTFFTFKGQVVLMILIKLGGLNIIAFGSFLALAAKLGVGVKQHEVLEDFVHKDSFNSARGMLTKVVVWSTTLELVGAVLLYGLWDPALKFSSVGQKVFHSIFHAVSAWNNAGITLYPEGLGTGPILESNYLVHWVMTILVFLGALGMVAIFDLFDIKNLRDRMANPWKQISFPTKIALYFSIGLVVVGTIAFYALEYNNTLAGHEGIFGKLTTAVFQSVTRTSGFNTVDFGSVGVPMLFMMMILMFIGSSSRSTGGGIKTSTFAIIYADVMRTIRGKKFAELFKRTINDVLKSRAYSVLLFFITGNLIGIFLLSITEGHILEMTDKGFVSLAFEHVSAMGTVGLSMGITNQLSVLGKIIIMAAMFVGRVGTLTVAFALTGQAISTKYKLPEGHTMVG